ncbi:mechanosensitive ion channel family protein [Franzmannia qiaohouensis]|uniref:Mechanosensitive ion channel family protein n=1 Tax=Franzmannia qiaohouensis TaxID=1329370 RepID=A0ABU1HF56_9GAMM|nr:mechanosensitive ion channel family protein [Halomonas qiaohouensis]MDR5906095.1 mechanosensitive ion channel family protein [Halomonas qiaohouensis]
MLELLAPLEDLVKAHLGLPQWLLAPLLIIAVALLVDLTAWLVIWRLGPLLQRTRSRWDDAVVVAIRRPLRVWIWGFALLSVLAFLVARFEPGWADGQTLTGRSLFTLVMLAWAGLRMVKQVEQRLLFPPPGHPAKPIDASSASAISKVVGAIVLVLVCLLALQQLGVQLSGILAFGGLGGIMVGFAARDLLANFFSGLAVHLDDPFKVGDWIRSPDREIEGVVEDIGWRLTRIRTFDSRLLFVPNAAFSTITVENPSRMHNRRIFQTLGLRYQDMTQVRDVVASIREMLDTHEHIDHDQPMLVNFTGVGEHTLDVMLHVYTATTDWAEHQDIQQDVLLRIADILDQHDAALALPVRELTLNQAIALEASEHDADDGSAAAPRPPEPGADQPRGQGKLRGDEAASPSSNATQDNDA